MHYALKTDAFAKLSAKAGIPDAALRRAVAEMRDGLIDANLGGNVYKKRVAVGNKGKSGGSRTIIATNFHDRCFSCTAPSKRTRKTSAPRKKWPSDSPRRRSCP